MEEKKMAERCLELAAEGIKTTVEWHKRLGEGVQPIITRSGKILPDDKRGCNSPLGGSVW